MSDTEEIYIPIPTTKLWSKRDYYYKLTDASRQKIISTFEQKILNYNKDNYKMDFNSDFNSDSNKMNSNKVNYNINNNFNKINLINNNTNFNTNNINNINTSTSFTTSTTYDAFYHNITPIPTYNIDILKTDKYIKNRLNCKKLREFNLQLINYNKQILLEIESNIKFYKTISSNTSTRLIIKSNIRKLQSILDKIGRIRNYLSEIVLKGEECSIYIDACSMCVNRR